MWIYACLRVFIHQFFCSQCVSWDQASCHLRIAATHSRWPKSPGLEKARAKNTEKHTKCPRLNGDLRFRKICYVRSHSRMLKGTVPLKITILSSLTHLHVISKTDCLSLSTKWEFLKNIQVVIFLFSQFKETSDWSIHESMEMFSFPVTFYSLK